MAAQEDAHKNSVVARNNVLWDLAQYSDLMIRCRSREFKVHRAVVCPGSRFFSTACSGQFQEGRTSVIELNEDDPPTVHRMLFYLYNLDYDDTGDTASIAPYMLDDTCADGAEVFEDLTDTEKALHTRLFNNIIVYAIAGKYDVSQLKLLAREKVETLMSKHNLSLDLTLLIDVIFKTTPSSDKDLRSVAISFCKEHVEELESEGSLSYLLTNHGDLGLGMVLELMQDREEEKPSSDALRGKLGSIDAKLNQAHSVLDSMDDASGGLSIGDVNKVQGIIRQAQAIIKQERCWGTEQ